VMRVMRHHGPVRMWTRDRLQPLGEGVAEPLLLVDAPVSPVASYCGGGLG